MKAVTRFEANLLRLLEGVLGLAAPEQVLPLLAANLRRPPGLQRTAIDLVRERLARGTVLFLARHGGWRRERTLRDGVPVEGRLWQRHAPSGLGLAFSAASLDWLLWLTAEKPADKKAMWQPTGSLTTGDEWLVYRTFTLLLRSDQVQRLGGEVFARNGLVRLAHPSEFADRNHPAPDFRPWTDGPGSAILEVLQADFPAAWVAVERRKAEIRGPDDMVRLGRSQEQTLTALLDELDRRGRWDLARWMLPAAAALLDDAPAPRAWVGALRLGGRRLADRAPVYAAAAAFLRAFGRLGDWTRRARTAAFYDEEYPASQLWKADWEHWQGDQLLRHAARLVESLAAPETPIRGGGTS